MVNGPPGGILVFLNYISTCPDTSEGIIEVDSLVAFGAGSVVRLTRLADVQRVAQGHLVRFFD